MWGSGEGASFVKIGRGGGYLGWNLGCLLLVVVVFGALLWVLRGALGHVVRRFVCIEFQEEARIVWIIQYPPHAREPG